MLKSINDVTKLSNGVLMPGWASAFGRRRTMMQSWL